MIEVDFEDIEVDRNGKLLLLGHDLALSCSVSEGRFDSFGFAKHNSTDDTVWHFEVAINKFIDSVTSVFVLHLKSRDDSIIFSQVLSTTEISLLANLFSSN